MEWQKIESASRNGKAKLVWVPEVQCIFCATWINEDSYGRRAGWRIFGGEWRDHLQRATHWMPPPEPPKESDD